MKNRFLTLIVFVLFSCNSTKNTSNKNNMDLCTPLYSSNYNGKDIASNLVIQNQSNLNILYASLSIEEIPKIDFTKSQVVALFLGQKNNGGYTISIDRVEETSDKIIIYKKIEIPKPGEMVTMAITKPYIIVKIKSKKNIVIE